MSMTLKEFLIHLWSWITIFPNPFPKDVTISHCMVSHVGEAKHKCLVCGRIWIDKDLLKEE